MPQLEIPPPPGQYVNSYYCPICQTPLDDGYCHSCDVVPSTARFAPYWKAAAVTDQAVAKQHTALVTILEGLNAERAEHVNARSTAWTEDTREWQTSPTPADENPFAVPNADAVPGIPAAPDSEASPQAAAYAAAMADETADKTAQSRAAEHAPETDPANYAGRNGYAEQSSQIAAPRTSPRSGADIAKILVGIGSFLLGIAVLTFLAVSWALLDLQGRVAVGAVLGLVVVGGGRYAESRGLRSTGQSLAGVATAVFYLCAIAFSTVLDDGDVLPYTVIVAALLAGGLYRCNRIHNSLNYRIGSIVAALISVSTIAPWFHDTHSETTTTNAILGAAAVLLPLGIGAIRFFRTQWLTSNTGLLTMLGSLAASLLGLTLLASWNADNDLWMPALIIAVGLWGFARLHPRPSVRQARLKGLIAVDGNMYRGVGTRVGTYTLTTLGRLIWQGVALAIAAFAMNDGLSATLSQTFSVDLPNDRVSIPTICVITLVLAGLSMRYVNRDNSPTRSPFGADDDGILTMFKVAIALLLLQAAGLVSIAVVTLGLLVGTPLRSDLTFSDTLRHVHPDILYPTIPWESSLWMLFIAAAFAALGRVARTPLLLVPAWIMACLAAVHGVAAAVPTWVPSTDWDMLVLGLALIAVGAAGILLTHKLFPAQGADMKMTSPTDSFSQATARLDNTANVSRINRLAGLALFSAPVVAGVHCTWMASWVGTAVVILSAAALFTVAARTHTTSAPFAYVLAAGASTAVIIAPWAGFGGHVFDDMTAIGFVGAAAIVAIVAAAVTRHGREHHAQLSAAATVIAAMFLVVFGVQEMVTFLAAGRSATASGPLTFHAITLAILTIGYLALRLTPRHNIWVGATPQFPEDDIDKYINTALVTAMGATGAGVLMVPGLIGGTASFASTIGYGTWQALCEVGVAAVAVYFLRRSLRTGDSSTSFVTMVGIHTTAATLLATTTVSQRGELGWLTCVALVPVLAASARVSRGQFIARPFAVLAVIAACVGWCWRMADGGTTTLEWYTWPVAGFFAIIAGVLIWLATRKRTAAATTVDDAANTGGDTPESAEAELGDAGTLGTATPAAAHMLLTNSGTSRFLALTAYGLAVLPTASVGVGNSLWREWVALAASAIVAVVLLGARRLGMERSTRGAWLGLAAASLVFGPIPHVMMLDGFLWAMYAAITAVTIVLAYGSVKNYASAYQVVVNTYCAPAVVMLLMLVVNMVVHPHGDQPFSTIMAVFSAAVLTLVVPLLAPTLVTPGRERTMFATNATTVVGAYTVLWFFLYSTPLLDTLWFIIIGVTMAGIGLVALYTDEKSSSVALFAPGYVLAVLPHAFHQVFYPQTNPLLGLAVLLLLGTVALLIGLRAHFIAPTILGGTTLILTGLHLAHKLGSNVVPTSVVIGAVGVVLLVLGATAEKRLQEFRAVKAHLSTFR